MSIMKFNVFLLVYRGRYTQILVSEIWGEKFFGERVAAYHFKVKGHVTVCVCVCVCVRERDAMLSCCALLIDIIRPKEIYTVAHTNILVYYKYGVAANKLDCFFTQFFLAN